jgi:hypothetical protein
MASKVARSLSAILCGMFIAVFPSGSVGNPCIFNRDCSSGVGGETPNAATGPNGGASGAANDSYLFVDSSLEPKTVLRLATNAGTSQPPTLFQPTTLTTPLLSLPTGGAVTFSFHMHGSLIGTLQMLARVEGSRSDFDVFFTRTGQQHTLGGSPWTLTTVVLPPATTHVIWNANYSSDGAQSDIAVDSISIVPIAPFVPTMTLPFRCGFDSPLINVNFLNTQFLCGMLATGKWKTGVEETPSTRTGPSAGESGISTDRYAFLEASGSSTGGNSSITTPTFSLPTGGHLRFSYHVSELVCGSRWNASPQVCMYFFPFFVLVVRSAPSLLTNTWS